LRSVGEWYCGPVSNWLPSGTVAAILHCEGTERLRRDVAKLHGRIQPFDGEIPLPEPDIPEVRAKWPIPDALNMIERARASLLGCERELAAIRARIDSIERDAISRMKRALRLPTTKTTAA
jgi:hypothetical protein